MELICEINDITLAHLKNISHSVGVDTSICPITTAHDIAKEVLISSCGKGVFCRDGFRQIYMLTEDITLGKGKEDDLDLLAEILDIIIECADCILSRTAATMIESLLNDYYDEWNTHIKRKSCKALVCPGCHTVHIDPSKCTGMGACIKICPSSAILGGEGLFSVINQANCTSCNLCIDVCDQKAIAGAGTIKPQSPTTPAAIGSFGGGSTGDGGRRRRRG